MFASGPTIYYANSTDGSLHAVTYSDGGTNGATPTVTASTDHVVSGPNATAGTGAPRACSSTARPVGTKPPTAGGYRHLHRPDLSVRRQHIDRPGRHRCVVRMDLR